MLYIFVKYPGHDNGKIWLFIAISIRSPIIVILLE